jgi:hypothetical protein
MRRPIRVNSFFCPWWVDLGFRFAQEYWGKGVATEVASACVRAAFDELRLSRLGAFVDRENRASVRILEKLGFHAERRETVMGMDSIVFSLDTKLAAARLAVELTPRSDDPDPNRLALFFWILQPRLLCLFLFLEGFRQRRELPADVFEEEPLLGGFGHERFIARASANGRSLSL